MMKFDYAIRTLENRMNKLEDILCDIDDGVYHRHPDNQIKEFKRQTIEHLRQTTDAIRQLQICNE